MPDGGDVYEQLRSLLDDVEDARRELMASLERLGEVLSERDAVTEPGFRMSERSTGTGIELHEELIHGLERMHHALAAARAESVRIMVDDEDLTLTDVARMLNRPRQLVSRLYRSASEGRART